MNIIIDDELVNVLKTKINLANYISKYTQVFKDNDLYKANCPFRKEKTPSLIIYPPGYKDDFWNFFCYGCGAGDYGKSGIGNDIIAFVMAINKIGFKEAVLKLCEEFNINYKRFQPDPEAEKMKKDMTAKNLEYYYNLINNQLVLNYLSDRGVTSESIKNFRLGLTPPSEFPDWKKNRLVFGITDVSYGNNKPNTIAMSFRNLQGQINTPDGMEYFPNGTPDTKYRHNKESKIFKKRYCLYALDLAGKKIREFGFAIVVEGFMDAILLHQSNYQNTVATMGTAVTEEQMDILKCYTNKILFFLDNDEGGIKSMRSNLPLLLNKGFEVSICTVDQCIGKDPADLCNYFNQDHVAITNYINEISIPGTQWIAGDIFRKHDKIVYKAKMEALKELLPILNSISKEENKILFTSEIELRLGVSLNKYNSSINSSKEPCPNFGQK